jgi:hypothetical protein
MWIRSSLTLIVLASMTSCSGDDRTLGDVASDQCRTNGGLPYGSAPEDLVCLDAAPTAAQAFDSGAIDTDQSVLCGNPRGAPEGCVVAATTITITGRLRATGRRPLILVADEIMVTAGGVIDVAAHSGDPSQAPGADPISCLPDAAPLANGCGAGGAFGGAGGNSGDPQCAPEAPEDPTELRGGCSGHRGGTGGGAGGVGGGGGGGVLLIARALTLDGKINASGAGGAGAAATMFHGGNGGGGGGSGGMIAIDANTLSGSGVVMANGGGGGAGDGQFQMASPSGSDPDEANPMIPAPGAPGVVLSVDAGPVAAGGAGGAGASPNGADGQRAPRPPVVVDISVGGGGGGAGVIRFYAARLTTGTLSPSP